MTIHATKLHRPRPRANWIARERLLKLLDDGLRDGHRLILVSAPAGAGKTTLLGHWLAERGARAAWLSLDPEDDEPVRFWTCLLHAVQSVVPGLGQWALEALSSQPPPPLASLLPGLLNEMGALAEPLILVLDDYHIVTTRGIHEGIASMVDHLPEQICLVLCTRADPSLPLARWRARAELTEVRGADLRFTAGEALAFLNQRMALDLPVEDAALLVDRTEGWAAGLQMAGLSLQGRPDPHVAIQSFAGSQHYVMEYLLDEVLARQPEHIQSFLTRTAVLDRLCGPLCDALTGQAGGAATLVELQRQNLFLIPLDEEHAWYRYHHLFADLLRARLQQLFANEVGKLHLAASFWFEANGDPTQAVRHALAAKDWDRTAELIKAGEHHWWDNSDMGFMRLLQQLPDEVIRRGPELALFRAWFLLLTGQLQRLAAALDGCELAMLNSGSAQAQGLQDFVTLQRAYIAEMTGEPGDKPVSLALVDSVPESRVGMRNSADVLLAYLFYRNADFATAGDLLQATIRRDVSTGGTSGIPIAVTRLARMWLLQGRLHDAAGLCRRYLSLVEERGRWRHYVVGNLNIMLGEVLRLWNRLDEAEACVRVGIEDNEPWGIMHADALGRTVLARLGLARGNLPGAAAALEDLAERTQGRNLPPDQVSGIQEAQMRLWLATHDLAAVERWADERVGLAEERPVFRNEADSLALARAWIALDWPQAAISLLQRLIPAAADRALPRVEGLLLLACAWQAAGQPGKALAALEQSLFLAAPIGCLRLFLDEGPAAMALLGVLSRGRDLAPAVQVFIRQALAAAAPGQLPPDAGAADPSALVEPLTPREREVLLLLAAGCSNGEIAERLVISVHAVKKHTGNIYGKLGVTSRTQSILRARELGLLAGR